MYDISIGVNLSRVLLTSRTISPFTRSEAAMDWIELLLKTLHEGGIMARNEARIASDFASWYHSMNALRKATAIRIAPR